MQRGKLIIIEGIDGSGKTTQTKLLIKKLKQIKQKVKTIHFPQHGHELFGKLVDEYLNNKFGPAASLDYRLASVLYALDRFEAKEKINNWLNSGYWVVLDRYAESNFGHQAGKITQKSQQKQVIKWLYNLDYRILKNPRPDLVLFLDMPVKFVRRLLKASGKKLDAHEKNRQFLVNSRQAYLIASKLFSYWQTVTCIKGEQPLPITVIHQDIYNIISKKFKLNYKL